MFQEMETFETVLSFEYKTTLGDKLRISVEDNRKLDIIIIKKHTCEIHQAETDEVKQQVCKYMKRWQEEFDELVTIVEWDHLKWSKEDIKKWVRYCTIMMPFGA